MIKQAYASTNINNTLLWQAPNTQAQVCIIAVVAVGLPRTNSTLQIAADAVHSLSSSVFLLCRLLLMAFIAVEKIVRVTRLPL